MNLDEKIKNKFLLSKKFNIFKLFYFINQKIRSYSKVKKSYSSNSVDLIINEIFKKKKMDYMLMSGAITHLLVIILTFSTKKVGRV